MSRAHIRERERESKFIVCGKAPASLKLLLEKKEDGRKKEREYCVDRRGKDKALRGGGIARKNHERRIHADLKGMVC